MHLKNREPEKSNLVFFPLLDLIFKTGVGQGKPQQLLFVCSSLTKYKKYACWLISARAQ
jgi:hypothetical protein